MDIKSKGFGKLFLIPTSIEQDFNNEFLLETDKVKLKKIKHFIVETPKVARKALKKINPGVKIQDLDIMEHSNKYSLESIDQYFKPILDGNDVGLLSDSGAPCIADPGSKIVSKAHQLNIEIIPLIGPSSIILSLMASGLNGQKFCFHGYIPIEENKKNDFLKKIQVSIQSTQETQIFIETPYRNNKLLTDILKINNESLRLCIATNLTSTDQSINTATIKEWRQKNLPELNKKLCIFLIN